MAKTLTEAFEIKPKNLTPADVKDYEIFDDKTLLEDLRVKIVQNLIEANIPSDELLEDYFKTLNNILITK